MSHRHERHPYQWYQARPPYLAPGEETAGRDASVRAWDALMLSPTPEVWGQLLRGNAVPLDRLDQHYLARARRRRAL